MRWDNLTIDAEDRARLPGYREDAVVRHFEAPGGVRSRFYEVRAKSILNRVPEASKVPFRWTINPYRGCTHACQYCMWGGTPVLMADGRHKPIELLEIGDEIYGTADGDKYRRYVRTRVLDKWITIKPAYRVVLEGGTQLIVSGDHRFLTNRGWRHVMNSSQGQPDRPHLTTRNRLVGTGAFAPQPVESSEYRRGYLCGSVRGDGHIVTHLEALRRTRHYLMLEEIATSQWLFRRAVGSHREMSAIGTSSLSRVERVAQIVEWPRSPSVEWFRGFLAGIFDAEGCRSDFALRISNTDPQLLAWIEKAARRLGFDAVREVTRRANGLEVVRIRGGLAEHLRFFHLTDPAITRKRSIEGEMVKTFEDLKVAAIEPLGRALPLYDITTGTGDFIANGVVSHNCFARPTHKYLDFNAAEDFEREIVVKVNAPELLRAELARRSWKGEHVALGTNTDPYQWVEGRYRLMPGIWEAMRDAANPCSILTKSPLLLRDLELMKEIAARTEFSAALSVPTIDEKAWRATEPHTPNPRARLEAIAELTRAGIRTGVLIAPLQPGINDQPEQVAKIVELASEAGAAYITGIALHLRGEVKELWFEWLRANRPELLPVYQRLYRRSAYAPPEERERLAKLVQGPDLDPPARWRRGAGTREQAHSEEKPAEHGGSRAPPQGSLF